MEYSHVVTSYPFVELSEFCGVLDAKSGFVVVISTPGDLNVVETASKAEDEIVGTGSKRQLIHFYVNKRKQ